MSTTLKPNAPTALHAIEPIAVPNRPIGRHRRPVTADQIDGVGRSLLSAWRI